MKLDTTCQMSNVKCSPRGFTLLFAVLVGSLLFSLGIAIANVAVKEIILSAAGKESEAAFYASDTGTECALYWDINQRRTFPTYTGDPNQRTQITCNSGTVIALTVASSNTNAATTTFRVSFLDNSCAFVTVGKTRAGSTVIESRGRNDCSDFDNPQRVERALRVRY